MDAIKILEEKTKVKFLGTTGDDLKEYLEKYCKCFLEYHEECYYITEDDYDPEAYYLDVKNEKGLFFKDIFYDLLYNPEEECDGCMTLEDVCTRTDVDPLVKGYLGNESGYTLDILVEKVSKICKEQSTHATLSFDSYAGPEDLFIEFNNDKVTYTGHMDICDNNSEKFIIPYVWLAYRCGSMSVYDYLSHVEVSYMKSDEYDDDLLERQDRYKHYTNIDDIKAQLKKAPVAIENYNEDEIKNEEVATAFIESENQFILDLIRRDFTDKTDGYTFEYKRLIPIGYRKLNNLSYIFDMSYCLLHEAYLDKLTKTHLAMLISCDDETLDDTIKLLDKYPVLISAVMDYFVDKMSDAKFKEHCLRKYRLEENTSKYLIAIRLVEEIIEKTNKDCYVYLLNIPKRYLNIITEYLDDLPMDIVRRAIKNNYYVMKVYRNCFEVDDPLVLEILKDNFSAYRVLSDEAKIVYNVLNESYRCTEFYGKVEEYETIFLL